MTSEWMKVMLEEIERKKAEAEQARIEENRRLAERSSERGVASHSAGGQDGGA